MLSVLLSIVFVVHSTGNGGQYTLERAQWYVGNVELHAIDGSSYRIAGYYLLDTDDPQSLRLELPELLPHADYRSLSFTLGVDSLDNHGGPREGALDPMHGMYWTWSTGYIFLKIEGTAPASPQPKNRIEYHLGGFRAPYNNIRRVHCAITSGQEARIVVDVDAFMRTINVAQTPGVMDVRSSADLIDQAVEMFRAP